MRQKEKEKEGRNDNTAKETVPRKRGRGEEGKRLDTYSITVPLLPCDHTSAPQLHGFLQECRTLVHLGQEIPIPGPLQMALSEHELLPGGTHVDLLRFLEYFRRDGGNPWTAETVGPLGRCGSGHLGRRFLCSDRGRSHGEKLPWWLPSGRDGLAFLPPGSVSHGRILLQRFRSPARGPLTLLVLHLSPPPARDPFTCDLGFPDPGLSVFAGFPSTPASGPEEEILSFLRFLEGRSAAADRTAVEVSPLLSRRPTGIMELSSAVPVTGGLHGRRTEDEDGWRG